jgi:hypothetical protein
LFFFYRFWVLVYGLVAPVLGRGASAGLLQCCRSSGEARLYL